MKRDNRRYQALLLWLALVVSNAGWSASGDVMAQLRGPLFEAATGALKAANAERAALLAPTDYQSAAKAYRKAEDILTEGGNLDSIKRALERARKTFQAAQAQAERAGERFSEVIQARDDADNAEAERFAPALWRSANVALYEAAVALERGRRNSADRKATEAREGFRAAELNAIKTNYLSGTRTLLAEAEEKRAKRYAPVSLALAAEQLAEAERLLTEDRYDTDKARNLAQAAQHSARHASYVASAADELRRRQTTLESVLAPWEGAVTRVAEQLDLAVNFDNGAEQALASVQNAIVDLQSSLRLQDNLVAEQSQQLNALTAQLESLSQQLGDRSAAAERLNTLLAEQEAARQRFAEIEASFAVEEGTVLRKGSTVILRLIGLTFDSGSANLKADHPALLDKLSGVLKRFPTANIVIEGHTDAFGSDAGNLDLSQRRADAVKAYLLQQGGFRTQRLTALGYGEAQPLANNETAEGRRRNRRIDVVVYP